MCFTQCSNESVSFCIDVSVKCLHSLEKNSWLLHKKETGGENMKPDSDSANHKQTLAMETCGNDSV